MKTITLDQCRKESAVPGIFQKLNKKTQTCDDIIVQPVSGGYRNLDNSILCAKGGEYEVKIKTIK